MGLPIFFLIPKGPKIGGYPQKARAKWWKINRSGNPALEPGFSNYL